MSSIIASVDKHVGKRAFRRGDSTINIEEPIFQLMYVSTATRSMSTDEQRDLSDTSSANNQRDGITGVLTYRSGFILQILEGSEGAVRDLLLKIRQDTRHKNIDVLRETFIDRRQFTGWNMRLTTPAEILQPDSAIFQKLFQDNDESRDSYSIEAETLFILSTFSRDGRRAFT